MKLRISDVQEKSPKLAMAIEAMKPAPLSRLPKHLQHPRSGAENGRIKGLVQVAPFFLPKPELSLEEFLHTKSWNMKTTMSGE